eukprot:tig00021312_g20051.t1
MLAAAVAAAPPRPLPAGRPGPLSFSDAVAAAKAEAAGAAAQEAGVGRKVDVAGAAVDDTGEDDEPVEYRPYHIAFENWTAAAVVVIFLVYPTVTQQLFRMFGCLEIGGGERVLKREMSISCESSTYTFWVMAITVPFLVVFGLGVPLASFGVLHRNRHLTRDLDFARKFSFLYKGYRPERLYWETVGLLRKLTISFIVVFFEGRQLIQSLLGLGLLVGFFTLDLVAKPFQTPRLNALGAASLAASSITIYSGMFLNNFISDDDEMAVTVFLLAVNLAFLLAVALVVARNFLHSAVTVTTTFRNRVNSDVELSRHGKMTFRRVAGIVRHAYGAFSEHGREKEEEGGDADAPRSPPAISSSFSSAGAAAGAPAAKAAPPSFATAAFRAFADPSGPLSSPPSGGSALLALLAPLDLADSESGGAPRGARPGRPAARHAPAAPATAEAPVAWTDLTAAAAAQLVAAEAAGAAAGGGPQPWSPPSELVDDVAAAHRGDALAVQDA